MLQKGSSRAAIVTNIIYSNVSPFWPHFSNPNPNFAVNFLTTSWEKSKKKKKKNRKRKKKK